MGILGKIFSAIPKLGSSASKNKGSSSSGKSSGTKVISIMGNKNSSSSGNSSSTANKAQQAANAFLGGNKTAGTTQTSGNTANKAQQSANAFLNGNKTGTTEAIINGANKAQQAINAYQNGSKPQQAGTSAQNGTVTNQDYAKQTALGETDPIQQAALQAFITRQYAHQNAESGEGTYNGDQSMSLPDQQLLKQYQALWNQGKESGNQALMDAAHKKAESLRDNYRYYPLANSNGYGLGENNIGFIRDIVVRGDSLGNKYIDQYNRGTVTTIKYDKDGNFVNRYTGGNIAKHDARVAKEMQRTNERLANAGADNNTFAVRIADPNDANLSLDEIRAKYGGGISQQNNGIGLYTAPVAPIGQAAQQSGGNGGNIGYFDTNKDYAAAIKNAGSTQEMLQLQQERQNKLDWMNANGQNQKGYTNQIYGNYQNLLQMQQNGAGQQAGTMQQNGGYGGIPEYQGMTRDELFDGYNDMAASLESQRKALLQMALAQNQAAQDTAGQEFDDIARQAYILRRQQEVALPQQLAALGISGGGSETANLQLQADYQNNLNSNEQARQQMLKDYALQALQAQTQANSDISGYYADAQQQAMNAWQNEMANKNSWNQWAAGFQQQLNEYQNSLNQQTYNEILANRQYQNELQQQQLTLALQMGDYKKLAALGYDSSYLKRMQDAELEQMALEAALTRANIAKVNSSVTKGSGGGKKQEDDDNNNNNDNGGGNGGPVSVSGLMKLQNLAKVFGTKSNPLLNASIQKMLASGEINEATYNEFLKNIK